MPYARHSHAMPPSMTASVPTTIVRVRRAVLEVGSRNAITPLLTASTPVSAVHPPAKARMRSHRLIASAAAGGLGGGETATGWPPAASVLIAPIASAPSRH